MEINKQTQNAGDNSQLIQAQNIIIQGITEKRAREIWREEYLTNAQNRAQEARSIADERVAKLENKIIPKMVEYDNTLKAFSDPAFMYSLRRAQVSAASSDKEEDYDLLAELLLNRVKDGENRGKRLAINTAIDVVDKIPEDALLGLGMVYAIMNLSPITENFYKRLESYNKLYDNIIENSTLPFGTEWLEHLDLLSIIRLSPKGIGEFKKMENVIPDLFKSYKVTGLANDDSTLLQIKEDFKRSNIPLNAFIPHPLKSGFEMLDLPHDINQIKFFYTINGRRQTLDPTVKQKSLLQRALNLINVDATTDNELNKEIIRKWKEFPILKSVLEWWDNIPQYFTITPAGMALANAYTHGKDANIPKLK